MLGYGAFLLVLIQISHLTLAVPNPANGVLPPDPAAADDQFFKATTTEPATIPRETQSLAESAIPGAIVQRRQDSRGCFEKRAEYDDVIKARDEINRYKDRTYSIKKNLCIPVMVVKTAYVLLCGGKNPPLSKARRDVGLAIDQIVGRCRDGNLVGEVFVHEILDFSVKVGLI